MADLISREALLKELATHFNNVDGRTLYHPSMALAMHDVRNAPAVDAVEVATLEKWLYEVAMNNIGAPVGDMAEACEIIISRLGGLRRFAEERREENAAD